MMLTGGSFNSELNGQMEFLLHLFDSVKLDPRHKVFKHQ